VGAVVLLARCGGLSRFAPTFQFLVENIAFERACLDGTQS
jgi:hypothetical protein